MLFGRVVRGIAALGLCLALGLALGVAGLTTPAQAAESLAQMVTGPGWPHTGSDIKPDAGARFGRLPNGMRYVIYPNDAKGRNTSMRFLMATGSLQEGDDQLGIAHLVEHMAFRGSKNLKDGELKHIVEAEGFGFGSDVNAFTDYETTKYVLDLPSNETQAIETALFVLREIAGNLTFDGDAIEHERGVVLGEERMRASPASRAEQVLREATYPDSLYALRDPIGTLDSIRTAPRQALVDYYQDWYRPELAVLVVAGDFDVAGMEKRIQAVFGDWKPARPGPVRILNYAPKPVPGVRTSVYAEKNLYEGLSVRWLRPYIDKPESLTSRTSGYLKQIGFWALNDRFRRAAEDPAVPFLVASIDYDNSRLDGNITTLLVVPKPGRGKEAFLYALRMVGRLKADGVTAGELSEYIAAADAQVENMIRTNQTRFNSDIAEEIVSGLVYDNVFETATQVRNEWRRIKPALTKAAVDERISVTFNSDSIMLSRQGEDRAVMDEAALAEVFAEAQGATDNTAQAGPAGGSVSAAWPYTNFGPGARIAEKTRVETLGYTHYVLSNGVTVNIRPNAVVKNQILVKVRFGGGFLLFSPKEDISLIQTGFFDLRDGGLGKLSQVQLDKALSTRTFSFDYDLEDKAAVLTGYTARDSFAAQMQVLMAFTVDPGYRPEMFENVRQSLDYSYQYVRGSPDQVMGYGSTAWLVSNDPRYVFPDKAQMEARAPKDIEAIFRRTMTGVPVEINIAGDVRENEAIEIVRKTFGNLPQVPAMITPADGADKVVLPTDRTTQVFYHEGREDQAISMVVFPATDALSDTDDTRGLRLLTVIFNARLDEELRQKQGMAYDGYVGLTASESAAGFGYISAQGTVPPDKDQIFYDTVLKIAADIVGKGVTAAELERARNPIVQYMNDDTKNNEDWQRTLAGLYGNPVLWEYRVGEHAKYMKITLGDINTLARRYLKPEKVLRAKTVPAKE
ncbi:hypothetical protein ABAC460_20260 [Asticcacaulis sp. AC460]|uniref:M16 family metallopeptidase n=1 Tax=Asticcacaulis sp. AC460 TaxID=1282360 RepID=UPI0003C3BE4B|nr:insulinase family protein [Asticcacaulis sp. AC460]ESQ87360.1 hypothetical protein ABAC460_20260 [Asticcacaulis sp. AC460]